MDNKPTEDIARLDGFLSGISSLDGSIRSYSSFAYSIEPNGDSFDQALIRFFSDQGNLFFSSVESLENGFRDLELEIRNFVLRDIFCFHQKQQDKTIKNEISSRKKYVSFRLMDIISQIFETRDQYKTYKAEGQLDNSNTLCVFFGVVSKDLCLVLQFNDDRNNH